MLVGFSVEAIGFQNPVLVATVLVFIVAIGNVLIDLGRMFGLALPDLDLDSASVSVVASAVLLLLNNAELDNDVVENPINNTVDVHCAIVSPCHKIKIEITKVAK